LAREEKSVLRIRLLTTADIPFALGLSGLAGWNQTAVDWQRCLALQPDGCFVAEWQGTSVATTTTSIFGRIAWVAMVLVDETVRRRGIGRALMGHALDFLDRRGVATVRLQATPMGQPLYEQLGFKLEKTLTRYKGTPGAGQAVQGVAVAGPDSWEGLLQLDSTMSGTDRRALLLALFRERPGDVRMVQGSDGAQGFLTARVGARAVQIGPCVATAEAGPLLLGDAWHRLAGQRVFIDIPNANAAARRVAEAQGLTVQRPLTRMSRGAPVSERVELLWASSGPEKG
jgi:GNAT superfamily N-acetyltransferase